MERIPQGRYPKVGVPEINRWWLRGVVVGVCWSFLKKFSVEITGFCHLYVLLKHHQNRWTIL